jgi:hypothetical protein
VQVRFQIGNEVAHKTISVTNPSAHSVHRRGEMRKQSRSTEAGTFMSRDAIGSAFPAESNTQETVDQSTHDLIAARAYEIFQSRGAVDGADIDDWLEAEKEILQQRSQAAR